MHIRESRNHAVTKIAAFVQVVCDTMCTKCCGKWTAFDKVTVKAKNTDGPRFETQAWPSSVLIFGGPMAHVYDDHKGVQ